MGDEKRRQVENALCKKGFRKSNASHRKFVFHTSSGKKTSVWTQTSHGSGHSDISESNLRKMAGQCRLSLEEFRRLMQCPMSLEEYECLLKQRGDVRE